MHDFINQHDICQNKLKFYRENVEFLKLVSIFKVTVLRGIHDPLCSLARTQAMTRQNLVFILKGIFVSRLVLMAWLVLALCSGCTSCVLQVYFRCTSRVLQVYFTCFGSFLKNSRCFNKTQDVSQWIELDQGDFPCTQPLFSSKLANHTHI